MSALLAEAKALADPENETSPELDATVLREALAQELKEALRVEDKDCDSEAEAHWDGVALAGALALW